MMTGTYRRLGEDAPEPNEILCEMGVRDGVMDTAATGTDVVTAEDPPSLFAASVAEALNTASLNPHEA